MVTNDDSSGYNAYTGLQLLSQERPLFYFRTLVCQSAGTAPASFSERMIKQLLDHLERHRRNLGSDARCP
jgi:hypothetical protein